MRSGRSGVRARSGYSATPGAWAGVPKLGGIGGAGRLGRGMARAVYSVVFWHRASRLIERLKMLRASSTALTVIALVAALACPVASQAADSKLLNLTIARMKTTQAVAHCVDGDACALAIGRDVQASTAILLRSRVRMRVLHSELCIEARKDFVTAGDNAYFAAKRFMDVRGSSRTVDAYYYAACKVNATLRLLVAVC
jgi:hypothetical protein